jgi:hypothetical protein
MKLFFFICLSVANISAQAQYYYKDIIGTKETAELIKNYTANKVSKVTLSSFDADNTRSDDFVVEQTFSIPERTLKTFTRIGASENAVLTSIIDDKGNVVKTIDSSETVLSTTIYNYDASGKLASVVSSSHDTAYSTSEAEEHRWEYASDKPVRMLRIKNSRDTTLVEFKLDDKGNVIEEQSTHKNIKAEPVYYYYNSSNRLTDIVRYNPKAKRLLPEYMFEYSPSGQVIQKITVPANSSEYLIWRYQYDSRGLKIKEAIFNREKKLTGKIEYQYQTGS